ncbi:MAG: rhodanese-like domain-containing protein [Gammaproteobacteria bacterium]|nr:MAG: rhodanese-like domain-containing protein [Gammaproteobacteria bacterium]
MSAISSRVAIWVCCFIQLPMYLVSLPLHADDNAVNITATMSHIDTLHNGRPVRIQRNPDIGNVVPFDYSRTSRPCPRYCIQPMQLAPLVETIGELELLEYLRRIGERDPGILVIDSREGDWISNGMIPGAVHMPWTWFHSTTSKPADIARVFEDEFGVIRNGEIWDFNDARTLVFYCNGPWCGQSPSTVRSLLTAGYPPQRIKWYRGGMQNWLLFGLTVIKPKQN